VHAQRRLHRSSAGIPIAGLVNGGSVISQNVPSAASEPLLDKWRIFMCRVTTRPGLPQPWNSGVADEVKPIDG
jgi:hypothetical protein